MRHKLGISLLGGLSVLGIVSSDYEKPILKDCSLTFHFADWYLVTLLLRRQAEGTIKVCS